MVKKIRSIVIYSLFVITLFASLISADLQQDMNLSNANASFWGENSGDTSGYSVSSAGDVNNDGFNDLIIGAYDNEEGGIIAGQSYLIYGCNNCLTQDMNLSNADASFIGGNPFDTSGYSVSSAGDVNGDGFDDLIIGAYGNDEGEFRAGQSYLIYGCSNCLTQDMNLSNANASFWGENSNDYSGHSVSSAGDVNNDGFDDLLIGANSNDDGGSNSGKSYLIYGCDNCLTQNMDLSNANASFIGEGNMDNSGESVSSAGDVNNDGFDDLLIGANGRNYGGNPGKSYLIYGCDNCLTQNMDLSNANASFIGENSYDESGKSVSSAGDVNNDGFDDFLIGAYKNDDGGSNSGKSYLIYGCDNCLTQNMNLSNANANFIGENSDDNAGWSVSSAGDVNGDDFDDLFIGAYGNAEGGYYAGKSYLIYGCSNCLTQDMSLSNANASFWGENSGDASGRSVSSAGDVNNDGFDDLIIGAPYNAEGGNMAGQSYLIYGSSSGGSCGDGNVDPGEQCDDGNNVGGDGCSSICQIEGGAVPEFSDYAIALLLLTVVGGFVAMRRRQ